MWIGAPRLANFPTAAISPRLVKKLWFGRAKMARQLKEDFVT
jgi:hypothetical protein